jgi:hypothetical protein
MGFGLHRCPPVRFGGHHRHERHGAVQDGRARRSLKNHIPPPLKAYAAVSNPIASTRVIRWRLLLSPGFAVLLSACAPIRLAQAPGTFGTVVGEESGQPIAGAVICLQEEPASCTLTARDGQFRLPPRTTTKWMFFMVESFPDAASGEFTARADGYVTRAFTANFLRPVRLALRRV